MPLGPGKYDDLCTTARERSEAEAAIVMILNGRLGSGFSVQSAMPMHPFAIAQLLEATAREIRDSIKR